MATKATPFPDWQRDCLLFDKQFQGEGDLRFFARDAHYLAISASVSIGSEGFGMDISELLEAAKRATGAASDRQLAKSLDLAVSSLSRWRKGHAFPTDENIVLLCELAHIAPEAGLMTLNMWRSQGRARAIYGDMAHRLRLNLDPAHTSKLSA